jgi:hypothetical protein
MTVTAYGDDKSGAAPTNWVAPNFLTSLVDFDAMLLLRCFLAERALR